MSVEFVDTNVLIYAHEPDAGRKRDGCVHLLRRLFDDKNGAVSIQILCEFYSAATRKLRMPADQAERILLALGTWTIHTPRHSDVIRAARLAQRYQIGWWDALTVNSANELGCAVLWTEDLHHGQRYGSVLVRNPFA
jgi:predicted nucleic acid-binding protein